MNLTYVAQLKNNKLRGRKPRIMGTRPKFPVTKKQGDSNSKMRFEVWKHRIGETLAHKMQIVHNNSPE